MSNEVRIRVTAKDEASTVVSGTEKRLRSFASGVGDSLKVAGVVGTAALVGLAASSVSAASDFNESLNKTRVVFKGASGDIENFAKGAANNLGISSRAALDFAGTFGNTFDQLKIGSQQSAEMSKSIIQLAADFGSFHNADISDVLNAQSAAFRGEYDALQRYLPLINAAAVENKALEMTHKDNAKALNQQEKALATYALMLEGAGEAQGDFARTADSGANVNRRLTASFEDLKVTIGQKLQPIVERAMGRMVELLQDPRTGAAIDDLTDAVGSFAVNFERGFTKTVIPAFTWVINNKAVLVGAVVAVGLAFAWTNPVAAAFVGAGGLIALVGLFSQSLDDASTSSLNLRLKLIGMAKDGIGAMGELLKVMGMVSLGPAGIPAVISRVVGGPSLNPLDPAINALVKGAQNQVGSALSEDQTRAAVNNRQLTGYVNAFTDLLKLADQGKEPVVKFTQAMADGTEATKKGADALSHWRDSLDDALSDMTISYDEFNKLNEDAAKEKLPALTQAMVQQLEIESVLAHARDEEKEKAFSLANMHAKITGVLEQSREAGEKLIVTLKKEALEKLKAASSALFGQPTQEQAQLQLKLAELEANVAGVQFSATPGNQANAVRQQQIQQEIASLNAAKERIGISDQEVAAIEATIKARQAESDRLSGAMERLLEPYDRQREQLTASISLLEAQHNLQRAQLTAADATLLRESEQKTAAQELTDWTRQQSAEVRSATTNFRDLIPELAAVVAYMRDLKTTLAGTGGSNGGGNLTLAQRGVPVFSPPRFANSGGIS